MNGTMGVWEKIGLLMENALAWLVESGALGAVIVWAILATIFGGIR